MPAEYGQHDQHAQRDPPCPARSPMPSAIPHAQDGQHAAELQRRYFGHVSAGGTYPIARPGGDWRAFVREIVLTATLVSVILNTATGHRSIGHNAAIAVMLIGLVRGLPDRAETEAAEGSALSRSRPA